MPVSQEQPPKQVQQLAQERDFGAYVLAESHGKRLPATCGGIGLSFFVTLVGFPLAFAPGLPLAAHLVGYGVLASVVVIMVVAARKDRRNPPPVAKLHCFERGMVIVDGERIKAQAWRDVLPYEWIKVSSVGQGNNKARLPQLRLTTHDGTELYLVGGASVEKVARVIDDDEWPRVLERLAAEGRVTYGAYTVSTEGFREGEVLYRWSQIRRDQDGTRFEVRKSSGRWRKLVVTDQDTPYRHILLELLARELDEASR